METILEKVSAKKKLSINILLTSSSSKVKIMYVCDGL